jgi:hypothetical protein
MKYVELISACGCDFATFGVVRKVALPYGSTVVCAPLDACRPNDEVAAAGVLLR